LETSGNEGPSRFDISAAPAGLFSIGLRLLEFAQPVIDAGAGCVRVGPSRQDPNGARKVGCRAAEVVKLAGRGAAQAIVSP
jgi:hypothetical protein